MKKWSREDILTGTMYIRVFESWDLLEGFVGDHHQRKAYWHDQKQFIQDVAQNSVQAFDKVTMAPFNLISDYQNKISKFLEVLEYERRVVAIIGTVC